MAGKEEEVGIEEARRIVNQKNSKFVWLGDMPRIDMTEALEIDKEKFEIMNPNDIYYADRDLAEKLSNNVLVCPHGNTSLFLAQHLIEEFGIDVYSLHGGISAIVGEGNY